MDTGSFGNGLLITSQEKTFSKFADFDANQDLFSIEEGLWALINEQLTQEIYNASVGNW
jgi:hypothetical protein